MLPAPFEAKLNFPGEAFAWAMNSCSVPGTAGPAYFTRGSGHNELAQYTERPDDYVNNLTRLARKFDTAKTMVPAPVVQVVDGASVGIIAFGSSHFAVEEARELEVNAIESLLKWVNAHGRSALIYGNTRLRLLEQR